MNSTLSDILLAEHHKDALIADCAKLFDNHIGSMGGLKGMTAKTAWAMVKTAKADLPQRAATRMLPDLAAALDPLYQKFRKSGVGDFGVYLSQNAAEVGQKILSVADEKAGSSQIAAVRSAWPKFRGTAEAEVQALAPKLGKLFAAYLS